MVFLGVIVQSVPGVNDGMFIGGRFMVGFGSNLSQGSAPLLIMEASYSHLVVMPHMVSYADYDFSSHIPSTEAKSRPCTTPCGMSAPS